MDIQLGKKVKNFSLPATNEQKISLKDLKGQIVVLYFYPRDNTPGCTQEGHDFNEMLSKFKRQGALILGVSRDSVKSHEKFKEKQGYKFDLLADEESQLCDMFNVIKDKNMYGKKVKGIERSTFIIDDEGVLVAEWRKVKVDGHAESVLEVVKAVAKGTHEIALSV